MYAIYDTKDNEVCVGIYETGRETAEALGISTGCLYSNVTRKVTSHKGLKVEKIGGKND